eukprot:GHVU01044124.1.p3 GENE.GHVU01044124.1~~GHVU01044124.1.p3  ORF type:complete len:103 (+),score=12.50 GHVU01044124.1:619-927(+)
MRSTAAYSVEGYQNQEAARHQNEEAAMRYAESANKINHRQLSRLLFLPAALEACGGNFAYLDLIMVDPIAVYSAVHERVEGRIRKTSSGISGNLAYFELVKI